KIDGGRECVGARRVARLKLVDGGLQLRFGAVDLRLGDPDQLLVGESREKDLRRGGSRLKTLIHEPGVGRIFRGVSVTVRTGSAKPGEQVQRGGHAAVVLVGAGAGQEAVDERGRVLAERARVEDHAREERAVRGALLPPRARYGAARLYHGGLHVE